jgi:hypothetical protein
MLTVFERKISQVNLLSCSLSEANGHAGLSLSSNASTIGERRSAISTVFLQIPSKPLDNPTSHAFKILSLLNGSPAGVVQKVAVHTRCTNRKRCVAVHHLPRKTN